MKKAPLTQAGQKVETKLQEETFDISTLSPAQAPNIIGLEIELRRRIDHDKPCCSNIGRLGEPKGPHGPAIRCAQCEQFRGWMPRMFADWLQQMETGGPRPVLFDHVIQVGNVKAYTISNLHDWTKRLRVIEAEVIF
jgi:hypothetical protein